MAFLEIKNLVKNFPVKGGFLGRAKAQVQALRGVDLSVEEGKTLGLVGESGCGKSTLARVIMRLIQADEGSIQFRGEELLKLKGSALRKLRKDFQVVFQDPYSSLNPRMTVGSSLEEGLKILSQGSKEERQDKVAELLKKVGLPAEAAYKYPHEFSGGQRQRIGIARALSLLPKLIVCDEPVSALDVSIQSQILNLLLELKEKYALTYLFISHDLKVVQHVSDEIAVMYLGKIVEKISSSQLMECRHPYTQALLMAVPNIQVEKIKKTALSKVKGEVPSPINPPSGCSFHPRCPFAEEVCKEKTPMLVDHSAGHAVACHFADKIPKVHFG